MGKKPSDEVGTKMAQEYAYDIIELGLTASQTSHKHKCSTQKVVAYIRRYLSNDIIEKFERIMSFNKTHHPYMPRASQTDLAIEQLRKTLKEGTHIHETLNEFYRKNCMETEPHGAIKLAQRAGINESIAEKEYKKFRQELRRV